MLKAGHATARVLNHRRLLAGALPIMSIMYVWYTYVSLLRDEGQVPTDSRRQQNMHRHDVSVVVNGEVVQWHGACNVYLFHKRY